MFMGVLWNTYFTTNSILKMFIPSRCFRENGAYYSVVPEEKHPDDDWASVTIQIPVYLESFVEVIKVTLKSCMESADYYREQTGGKVNIVVCDDGIMALLQNSFEIAHLLWAMISSGKYHPTIEVIRKSLAEVAWARVKSENIKEENLEEVIRRLLFYFKHDIGFVARSTLNRRGKFKKASNLNTHLRIAFGARDIQDEHMMGWNDAINLLTQDDNGQQAVFCSSNIQIGDLVVLNDSDARMAQTVIKKTVPEFLNDEALAFTQHNTKVMDEQRGKSSFLRLIGVYTDALYQGHFLLSSIMGIPPPLVGHSTFIKTDAIRQCGRMRNLRTAQQWLKDIGLSFLGVNSIRNDCLQCPIGSEYWSESHVSEDFELMIHLYNLGYKGRYIAYPDCEFQEGVTRTFDEEATRHRKFSLGAHELMFNPFQDILGQGILTPLFRTFLTCSLPSYYKIYLASYLQVGQCQRDNRDNVACISLYILVH
jgi:cellulose synthase/poly-beta-1,6-N-acetylglucosamine synthase-like glycosyltransferase